MGEDEGFSFDYETAVSLCKGMGGRLEEKSEGPKTVIKCSGVDNAEFMKKLKDASEGGQDG